MRVTTENEHKRFVSEYKKTHKVLNLQIKQKYLTAIMCGRKVTEQREIRPTTESKYIERDAENFALEDKERFITTTENIEVDVAKNDKGELCVVYVNDDNERELLPIYEKTDGKTKYEAVDFMGETFEIVRASDKNGKDLLDENGLPYMAIVKVEELHCCVPIKYDAINFYIGNTPNTDHALVKVVGAHTEFFVDDKDEPIWYEYNGEKYYAEQVVYDLGEIICQYNAPKANGTKI